MKLVGNTDHGKAWRIVSQSKMSSSSTHLRSRRESLSVKQEMGMERSVEVKKFSPTRDRTDLATKVLAFTVNVQPAAHGGENAARLLSTNYSIHMNTIRPRDVRNSATLRHKTLVSFLSSWVSGSSSWCCKRLERKQARIQPREETHDLICGTHSDPILRP